MALGPGRTAPLSIEGFRLGRGVVVDRASLDVECLGPVWRLNDPGNSRRVIDWRRFAEVRDDVAYVRFATGCSAPDQLTKDEIMGVLRQRVQGLSDVVELAPEPAGAFVALDTLRIGPPA